MEFACTHDASWINCYTCRHNVVRNIIICSLEPGFASHMIINMMCAWGWGMGEWGGGGGEPYSSEIQLMLEKMFSGND